MIALYIYKSNYIIYIIRPMFCVLINDVYNNNNNNNIGIRCRRHSYKRLKKYNRRRLNIDVQ